MPRGTMRTCAKCGQPHWAFQPCPTAPASNQAGAAPAPEEKAGQVVFTPAQRARLLRPWNHTRKGYRDRYSNQMG